MPDRNPVALALPLPALAALAALATAGFASMASMRLCDARVPALGASLGRAAVDRSSAITAFTIAYGLMQLVDDPLDDRYGKPRVIALATLACALGALAAALSDSFSARVASHALMGASAAGIIAMAMAWVGGKMAWRSRCSPVCSLSASHWP